jgi:hypothetical protein
VRQLGEARARLLVAVVWMLWLRQLWSLQWLLSNE